MGIRNKNMGKRPIAMAGLESVYGLCIYLPGTHHCCPPDGKAISTSCGAELSLHT